MISKNKAISKTKQKSTTLLFTLQYYLTRNKKFKITIIP